MSKRKGSIQKAKQSQVEKVMNILIDDNDVTAQQREELLQWFAGEDKAAEKSEAFIARFSEAIKYEENPKYMPDMWPELARRLGISKESDPNPDPKSETPHTADTAPRILLRRRVAVRVAAVLIPFLVVVTAWGLLVYRTGDTTGRQVADVVTVSVPAAGMVQDEIDDKNTVILDENAVHILPDNSTVRLGKGSEIRQDENFGEKRHVTLKGEARFSVTKAQTPQSNFTVHTEHLKIAVLGTEFKVHSPADDRHSTIDLYHGSIEVEAGGRKLTMAPRDHLNYDHSTKQMNISRISLRELSYEMMPGLVFENTPVMEIVGLLERDYGVKFSIVGTIPTNPLVVEGDLTHAGTLDKLLSTIQMMSGRFTYEIADDEVIIRFNE